MNPKKSDVIPSMNQYNSIGKFVAIHGLQGELVLQHNLGKRTALKGLENLFLEARSDEMIPYFIAYCRVKDAGDLYIKLEGIDTRETAKKLIQKEVWLYEADFRKYAAASSSVSLLGYQVFNDADNLGEIVEVIEQPHQILCRVVVSGNDALLPVHAETLKKIDKKKRLVYLSLPEGLLDIYK